MTQNLTARELQYLVETVFAPTARDKQLLVLVDVPSSRVGDTLHWRDRRMWATEWQLLLQEISKKLGFAAVELVYYENCGSNNADLPGVGFKWGGEAAAASVERLNEQGTAVALAASLSRANIVFAPTEFSATAPLKLLAKQHGFRAASMPGFHRKMIPALKVDYEAVHAQVLAIKQRLDRALDLWARFRADKKLFELRVDLRNRQGHASSGLIREPGTAWNLPSGEAFIVPYEGELEDESHTSGVLPVQFGAEIVEYAIENNRAVRVLSEGAVSKAEAERVFLEPAYGNLAEIGFGVLRPFGIGPIGEMLLDEKLGLHIAFGRSDHFGGATSAADFNDASRVTHVDRIFIPEVQDRVEVLEVSLGYQEAETEVLIKDGAYLT